MKLYGAVVSAICVGVLLVAFRTTPCPEPSPTSRSQPLPGAAVLPVRAEVEPIANVLLTDEWAPKHDHRNLFAYAEARKLVTKIDVPTQKEIQVAPLPLIAPQIAESAEKREPEMTYRYIGTFGHSNDPMAVFTRDGEVVNAHAGDTVEAFRVEQVGFEGVEVRASGADAPRKLPNRR